MSSVAHLYIGTHRRAHHADPADIAFGLYTWAWPAGHAPARLLGLARTPQPGWIATHPGGHFLYAVNEVRAFHGHESGGVSAFRVDPATGTLEELNSRPTAALPCHCEVDASGRFLLVASFGGGSVHLFPLAPDGTIGSQCDAHQHSGSSVHPRRQNQPHAHAVTIDPAGRFLWVPDLGIDQLRVYELDTERGRLIARPERTVTTPPGSGPRHLVFDGQARFLYLMNEMNATVSVLRYDARCGAAQMIQSVDLLPEGFTGLRSGAELAIHPSGRFLYATTRSHGSSGKPPVRGLDHLVWFDIDAQQGLLAQRGRVPSGGELPRSFTFDADGRHLLVAHQASGTIVVFAIDTVTGRPGPTGEIINTPVPVCVRYLRRGSSPGGPAQT